MKLSEWKQEQVQLTQPQGYSVKDDEAKVQLYLYVSIREIHDFYYEPFQLCDIDHPS